MPLMDQELQMNVSPKEKSILKFQIAVVEKKNSQIFTILNALLDHFADAEAKAQYIIEKDVINEENELEKL